MSVDVINGEIVIFDRKRLFSELVGGKAVVFWKNEFAGIHIVNRYVSDEYTIRHFLGKRCVIDNVEDLDISPIIDILKKRRVIFPAEHRYNPNRIEEFKKYIARSDSWLTVPKRSQCCRYYDGLWYTNKKELKIVHLNSYGMRIIEGHLYEYKPLYYSLFGDGVGFLERNRQFKETIYHIFS